MVETTHRLVDAEFVSAIATQHVSLVINSSAGVFAVAVRDGESTIIGRSAPATTIVNDPSLSRVHVRFGLSAGLLEVRDMSSTNGTWLAGRRIERSLVGDGDTVKIGNVEIRVSGLVAPESNDPRSCSPGVFRAQVQHEIVRAREFRRPASLLVLKLNAIPSERLLRVLRPVDSVLEDDSATFVLLPELTVEAAIALFENARRRLGDGIRAGLLRVPEDGANFDTLVGTGMAALRRADARRPLITPEPSSNHAAQRSPVLIAENMRRLYDLAARAARTHLPILVLGETGSGKELVARYLHDHSSRSAQPFKALNCATIPLTLIESVLFGHERGAFTGADKQSAGIFEQAQGGTVFLDEVGELSPQAQAALLRVLETKRIVRVGGTREQDVDVRVVAATHRNLAAMASAGQFREDLMFRLDALTLSVPPLRERRAEVRPLADEFLRHAAGAFQTSASSFSEDAYEALESYAWPGNVRQLKNAVERAAAVASEAQVELDDLPRQIADAPVAATPMLSLVGAGARADFQPLPVRVRDFEVKIIREALDRAHGNQAQAARMLGVPRRTLANKIHAYEMLDTSATGAD